MIQEFILGGYTRRKNKGISSVKFHSTKGTFKKPSFISHLTNPTYLTLSQDRSLLFSIDTENDQGGIIIFRRNDEDEWTEIDSIYTSEGSGCHIAYRESSQTIYVANYGLGQIDVYSLSDDSLSHLQTVKHEGSSAHENQDSSHVHYVGFDVTQNLLYVCDLGTDYVSTYEIDGEGSLQLSSEIKLPAGTGPRHLVQHPNEPYIYIIGELNNTTTIVSVDARGVMALVDTVENIDPQYVDMSAGAAIRITQDGRHLYTSTRFHNVLTVFEISDNGSRLTKIQEIDTRGEIPRDFILDKNDNFILVAHQDTDYISTFSRDLETGELTFINSDTYAPECVCIVRAN